MDNELIRVVDALPGLVWTALPDGHIDFVNQRWCEYTGLGVHEAYGSGWQSTIHPEDLPELLERWQSTRDSGEPYDIEARLRRFDGVYRWFLFRACALADASGQIAKWCGLNTDIDDRRRASIAVERAQSNAALKLSEGFLAERHRDGQLEYIGAIQDVTGRRRSADALGGVRSELARMAAISSLGALTESIAHEVNQPLSGIITNAGTCLRMLAADPPNIDGARETARRTIRDGNRASDVVTRLRALFAKKDAAVESMDLNEAAREVLALSLGELQSGRAVVRQEFADDLPIIVGDRVQIQQVILNLLLNAVDAMSGVDDRPRLLVIRTEPDDDDQVRLSVRDAGVGFEPQAAERLFEAFYTTKSTGMGIGLSVSRSIIESHHGRLWAAPNDGPGATFAFSIPRRPESVKGAHSLDINWTSAATDTQRVMRNP